MRSSAAAVLLFASSVLAAEPAPVAFTLPAEFTIRERVIALTDTFDVKSGKSDLGKITEKLISLTKSFTLTDPSGVCAAKARTRILSWGTHIDVVDCSDKKIGSVKEEVFKSLFKVHTTYRILDAADVEIAKSVKVEWISTSLTLTRPDGAAVATFDRPWLNILSDTWTVKIQNAAAVDPRMMVMIAAYKTSVDNDRRAESK